MLQITRNFISRAKSLTFRVSFNLEDNVEGPNRSSWFPAFQGLAGFTTNNQKQLDVGGRTLISNLYAQGQIDELRFGVAFGTAGTGTIVLGGVDHSLFEGELVYQPVNGGEWMFGNMSVTTNGSTVIEKQEVWLDTGGPAVSHSPSPSPVRGKHVQIA